MPIHNVPSLSSVTGTTPSPGSPCSRLKAVNLRGFIRIRPPVFVPIQRLPSRSSKMVLMLSSDSPSRVVNVVNAGACRRMRMRGSPSKRASPRSVPTHNVPARSNDRQFTLLLGKPSAIEYVATTRPSRTRASPPKPVPTHKLPSAPSRMVLTHLSGRPSSVVIAVNASSR